METTSASKSPTIHSSTRLIEPAATGPAPFGARSGSVLDLVQALTSETKTFMRQEIALAKTELSEKVGRMAREGASIGIGGFVAYAAAIVMLLGLGFLVAWAIHLAGIESLFASFLGLLGIGLLVLGVGGVLALQGLAGLRKESITPERTVHTLKELSGTSSSPSTSAPRPAPEKLSSQQAQARVEATEREMGQTMEELRRRLTVSYAKEQVTRHVSANAYRWSLLVMVAGVVGGFLLTRKLKAPVETQVSWWNRRALNRGRVTLPRFLRQLAR